MVPNKHNSSISPIQLMDRNVSDVSNVRTFGCRVLVKDNDPPTKFSVRTWDGIYMGPAAGADGHKIYDPVTKKMSVSRNVFFLERKKVPEFYKSPIIQRYEAPDGQDWLNDPEKPEEEETLPAGPLM